MNLKNPNRLMLKIWLMRRISRKM